MMVIHAERPACSPVSPHFFPVSRRYGIDGEWTAGSVAGVRQYWAIARKCRTVSAGSFDNGAMIVLSIARQSFLYIAATAMAPCIMANSPNSVGTTR